MTATETLIHLPLGEITPNPNNIRTDYGDLTGLTASIREVGLQQPLVVTARDDGWLLVAGHRRLRAAELAGQTEVPCVARDLTDAEVTEVMLVENLLRHDISYADQARAYARLTGLGRGVKDVAERTGVSEAVVRSRLRLLELPEQVLSDVGEGSVTLTEAERLLEHIDSAEKAGVSIDDLDEEVDVTDPWELTRALKSVVADRQLVAAAEQAIIDAGLEPGFLPVVLDGMKRHKTRPICGDVPPGGLDDGWRGPLTKWMIANLDLVAVAASRWDPESGASTVRGWIAVADHKEAREIIAGDPKATKRLRDMIAKQTVHNEAEEARREERAALHAAENEAAAAVLDDKRLRDERARGLLELAMVALNDSWHTASIGRQVAQLLGDEVDFTNAGQNEACKLVDAALVVMALDSGRINEGIGGCLTTVRDMLAEAGHVVMLRTRDGAVYAYNEERPTVADDDSDDSDDSDE